MDQVIPWDEWTGLIEPHYFNSKRGRKPVPAETMLRMYLLQVWFNLSDEAVEDAVNDSYAMRQFMRLDFGVRQVPAATTLLHFRHLLEKHQLGKAMFDALNRVFEAYGWIMWGGIVVDATIIAAPSSTKNTAGVCDPETKKGNQWYFGMKAHIGADAGSGYVHTVTATAANVHDLDEAHKLLRGDDRVVYADAGYQGIGNRRDIAADEHLSQVEFRVAARKGRVKTMTAADRAEQTRPASVRAKVEHPFLIVRPAQLGVLTFELADLFSLTGRHPGQVAGVDLRVEVPTAQRPGRDTKAHSDMLDRRELRRRIRDRLLQQAHR